MSPEPSTLWKTLRVPARILTTTLFDLKVFGNHHVPATGGVLMVSNHQSYLDPVLLGVQIRRPLCYMAKSELFENRAFAWLIRSLHAYPVRQGGQGAENKGAMEQTIRLLQEGALLNIFPEGTRSPDGRIHEMERGIALVIRRAKVPVVPAVIDGSYEAWKGRKVFRPWPIRLCYGPVMDLAQFDGKKIPEIVGAVLRGMFDALREADRAGEIDGRALDARVCALSASIMASAESTKRKRGETSSVETPAATSASTT